MPERPNSPLGEVYRCASTRTRALAAGSALFSFAAKIAVVMTAREVSSADATAATVLGVAAGLAFAAQRVLAGAARVGAECDLYRASSRAMLEGDVLSVPTASPPRTVFESCYYARQLVAETLPELAANALAALVVLPLLARELPARVLALSAAALVVLLGGALGVRRLTAAWQERVAAAQQEVHERTSSAIDGRLELVASGGEGAFARGLEGAITRYQVLVGRASAASALLGRAPIAAGAATVAIIVLVDPSSRDAVASVVFAKALLLASALPIVLGSVLGASEVVRATPRIRRLAELLSSPRRPELSRAAPSPPPLPAPIALSEVTFAYEEGAPPILRDLTFDWPAGAPLVLEGANGAGKSTVLRLLLGLRSPSHGAVTVGGRALEEMDLRALRRDVGYLPQRPYLGEPHVTVRASFALAEPGAADDAMTRALDRVLLLPALRGRGEEPLDVPLGELSAGQRQRLALARVLMRDAPLVLLDEPDANLDRAGIALVSAIVRELALSGKMIAIAAHTTELSAIPGTHVSL